ncbi:hypothetical protein CYMTET_20797 [Cymbomonas tetramitiformis]|uniref:Polycystin cation channel PKD1/PKD2 domain-containing protein n=1 Tax=Cymbomonas tetramitiformis TaxID=36881 RepID=A0AAE0G3F3_9CHLO|nr:hypothetical protein CYMTET_20797 [Cymbomonas tetramitiformis]
MHQVDGGAVTSAAAAGEASLVDGVPAWALPKDNSGLTMYAEDLHTMQWLGEMLRSYFIMQSMRMLIMMVRILVGTAKQKRLAVVLNTARSSMAVLVQMLSFEVALALFTMLFHVEMGHRVERYHTLGSSYRILSEFAFYKTFKKFRDSQWEKSLFSNLKDDFYVFAFSSLFSFIMSNILFCVVCDEVMGHWIEARNSESRTMVQDLTMFYKNRVNRKIKRKWPAIERVIDLLSLRQQRGLASKDQASGTKALRVTLAAILSGKVSQLTSEEPGIDYDVPITTLQGRVHSKRDLLRLIILLSRHAYQKRLATDVDTCKPMRADMLMQPSEPATAALAVASTHHNFEGREIPSAVTTTPKRARKTISRVQNYVDKDTDSEISFKANEMATKEQHLYDRLARQIGEDMHNLRQRYHTAIHSPQGLDTRPSCPIHQEPQLRARRSRNKEVLVKLHDYQTTLDQHKHDFDIKMCQLLKMETTGMRLVCTHIPYGQN